MTYEESVRWLRRQSEHERLLLDSYLDPDPLEACSRFERSEEFCETVRLLGLDFCKRGRLLDLGAGNGIAAHAFGRLGASVIAAEPNLSDDVGAGAIRRVDERRGGAVRVVAATGEALPFPEECFDIVYTRQVLHHAGDLQQMLREVARVLRPGGVLLAAREHVVDDETQLRTFLGRHILHQLHGQENAYPLNKYLDAIQTAGLRLKEVLGPWSTVLNHWPETNADVHRRFEAALGKRFGPLGRLLALSGPLKQAYRTAWNRADHRPGRMFSFISVK